MNKKRICISRTEIETLKRSDQARTQQPGGPKKRSEQELAQAIDLMNDIIRIPLGEDPKRDEQVKSAWRSGE